MTQTILVAGTASHVGKSTIAAGLCRLLASRGLSVVPYKAQNMSNNARVVVTPSGDWGEIGVSQYVQATAAEMTPTTDTNPVLLKPRGDGESQLVLQGEAVDHFEAGTYYEDYWEVARDAAVESYDRLAAPADVVVAEGAGSIAEINLHDRDLANVETARFADADILLVADIERGGAFASLYGTLELMPDAIRDQVQGAILTKFRGDASLLDSGIAEIEERTGVPIVGVVPHDDPGLPEEDSVSLPDEESTRVFGQEDGLPDQNAVTIAVPRLPHISNFTDMEPLLREPGVRVAYVSLDATLDDVDAVVLPGSKNTVDDLRELRRAGLDDQIRQFDGPIVGLCGGYQMLGRRILDAGIESTDAVDAVEGIGLLPVETEFTTDKHLEQVTVTVSGGGPLDGATGPISGYEIHMGRTEPVAAVDQPLEDGSAARANVLGTYIHGLFENDTARDAFLNAVFETSGRTRPGQQSSARQSPYEQAKTLVANNVDLEPFGL